MRSIFLNNSENNERITSFNVKILNFLNVCGPYLIMRSVNFDTVWNTIYYATLLKGSMNIYKLLNLCFAKKSFQAMHILFK